MRAELYQTINSRIAFHRFNAYSTYGMRHASACHCGLVLEKSLFGYILR